MSCHRSVGGPAPGGETRACVFSSEGGSDEMHYALGLGIAFERFQLDLGVDVSDLVDAVSLSIISSL